jgi:hypothetical protein
MKFSVNLIAQILGTLIQVLNFATALVPPDYHWLVAGIAGIVQAIAGLLAHFSNPDGTPSTVPYVAPK